MASYQERLQSEITRRDHALANVKLGAQAGAEIVLERLDDTRHAVQTEIESGKLFIREQMLAAENMVHREIDHAGSTVGRQIDHAQEACRAQMDHAQSTLNSQIANLKAGFRVDKIVREHPWGTTLAALLAGLLVMPLLKSRWAAQPRPPEAAPPSSGNDDQTGSNGRGESRWKPVTDAFLGLLPTLIAAVIRSDPKPAPADPTPRIAS